MEKKKIEILLHITIKEKHYSKFYYIWSPLEKKKIEVLFHMVTIKEKIEILFHMIIKEKKNRNFIPYNRY